jgi:hypothetical protein
MRKDDPTEGIKGVRLPKSSGHHPWTDGEIEQYRTYWPLGTKQRLVMEFALEAVSRRAEVVHFGPQHIKNGRIRIEHVHNSKPVDFPVTPELQAAYRRSIWQAPFGRRVRYEFAKWATQAGLPRSLPPPRA